MKNLLTALCFCLFLTNQFTAIAEENYGGAGIGYSEACRTKYEPGFSGGDCIDPNINVRGLVGKQISDYFAVEASLDVSFDPGHILEEGLDAVVSGASDGAIHTDSDQISTNRWSITTLAIHAFAQLPLGDSVRLFAGPSLGGSLVDFDYDVAYFGDGNSYDRSSYQAGLNYGGALGVDMFVDSDSFVRLQWQNWRSLDSSIAKDSEFNSNTFTVNLISYF
jgi:hypothetical protein